MTIFLKPSMEDLAHIKQSYADVVEKFKYQITDQMTLCLIQDALNDNARRIYDKFGRIIIKVGKHDYLDITSPKASFNLDTVKVDFTQVTKDGNPI